MNIKQIRITFSTIVFCLLYFNAFSQKANESMVYSLKKISELIKVDGFPDDKGWQEIQPTSRFYAVLPMDTGFAKVYTEVKMCFDDKNLYLLAINHEKVEGSYRVESLRRDFNFGKNDNFLLFIDPFNDQTNGFTFGSNAMGAQWDGLLYDGGKADLSWDNKWVSAVQSDPDKWTLEMAIPFTTLRYKPNSDKWGVNFSRLDMKTTEKSAWAPVPRQFPTASLAYTGYLEWAEPPPSPGTNISLIPFSLGSFSSNEITKTNKKNIDFGLDAKIAVSSSMNLDLTLKPDFSQVEVDVQQTNLDRFELFFPERRQFFIENGDLFNNFGYNNLRPFFSRRIGLQNNILGGARLSGKLNKNWRLGIMNMQMQANEQEEYGTNFAVLAIQRKLFQRSNIGAILVNREQFGDPSKVANRNIGLEYNLASSNNFWRGKIFYLNTLSPNKENKDQLLSADIQYTNRNISYGLKWEDVGKQVNAETGFVPRTGYKRLVSSFGYLFFPKSGRVLSHGPSLELSTYFNENLKQIESENVAIYKINFLSRADLFVWTATNKVTLLAPFDPTNYAGHFLKEGTVHRWNSRGFDFVSKPQSLITYRIATRQGGYYADGKRIRLEGEFGYRIQPYFSISLKTTYNYLSFFEDERLPEKLRNKHFNLWLAGPRLDLTLTNKLFITYFFQYNKQINNINSNFRLQWRYSPASDIYFVYTDNYYAQSFQLKQRQFVLKFNYWWNL
jgi:hypothetical protein